MKQRANPRAIIIVENAQRRLAARRDELLRRLVRVVPRAVRRLAATDGGGHLALASLWIVIALALFMYLVVQFISHPDDPNAINAGILIGSDHSVYIGVITNTVFAMLITILGARAGSAQGQDGQGRLPDHQGAPSSAARCG